MQFAKTFALQHPSKLRRNRSPMGLGLEKLSLCVHLPALTLLESAQKGNPSSLPTLNTRKLQKDCPDRAPFELLRGCSFRGRPLLHVHSLSVASKVALENRSHSFGLLMKQLFARAAPICSTVEVFIPRYHSLLVPGPGCTPVTRWWLKLAKIFF